ncbi:hypothetical protein B0E53_06430 [Micromonospora sp. MH33]|nr:hypothetical protein B0E53_06430 [Micromonospora sp. MH33]
MLNSVPQVIPLELLATTPPTVQADSLAGSGPSLRPYGASRALTCRSTTPGCTRTRRPSSRTSRSRKCRRVSTSSRSVTAWPLRLVPPERKVSGVPVWRLCRSRAATCSASAGVTTALGCSR